MAVKKKGRPEEIVLDDFRESVQRTQWVEEVLRQVPRGLDMVTTAQPVIARGEVRAVLRETLAAYFGSDESVPEILKFKNENGAMATGVWRTSYHIKSDKTPRGKVRKIVEQDLTAKNILMVALRYTNLDGNTHDWNTGDPVEPMVVIAAGDGSAAYVRPVVPRGMDLLDLNRDADVDLVPIAPRAESKTAAKKRIAAEKRAERERLADLPSEVLDSGDEDED